jgi:hypothetical protein
MVKWVSNRKKELGKKTDVFPGVWFGQFKWLLSITKRSKCLTNFKM